MTVYLIGWLESTFKYLSNGIKIIFLGAIGAEIWATEETGSREFSQTLTTHISMTFWAKKKSLANVFLMGHNNCTKFQANRSRWCRALWMIWPGMTLHHSMHHFVDPYFGVCSILLIWKKILITLWFSFMKIWF